MGLSYMGSWKDWAALRWARHCKIPTGESGQGGGGILPSNLIKIFLEFGALCLGNGSCSYVACLVVAVNEVAGAHEGGIVPLGAFSTVMEKLIAPRKCNA